MTVCQDRAQPPPLALMALETLLKLVEMAVQAEAPPPGMLVATPTTLSRALVTVHMVNRLVLTREFVKVI